MKISVQLKFLYTFLICIIIELVIVAFALDSTQSFIQIAPFIWFLITTYIIYNIKCPNCGAPVVYQGKLFGVSFFAGICRNKCASCDYDLTKKAVG